MTNSALQSPRVLMIGLDAAEPRLIERWISDGSLPTLKRLRSQGAYGRLASSADWLGGSPWPTFYTSRSPAEHGFYAYLAWRPDQMASVRPTPDYLPLVPFWQELSTRGPRVVAIDVPLTYEPQPFNGLQISNWATHDALVPPSTYPSNLLELLRSEFGPPQRTNEEYGLLPVDSLLRIRDDQNAQTEGLTTLATQLMRREPWDLFLIAFSATHRCGHKLWDRTGISDEVSPQSLDEFDDALRQVYISADRAVERLIQAAGDGVTTLVFSLHGMGENTSRVELLPEMLSRVLAGGPPAETSRAPSLLKRMREMIPNRWRNNIKGMLPLAIQDRLTSFWRMGSKDWSKTRGFCLVADMQGYIRFNVQGREVDGIVKQGDEYNDLIRDVRLGLMSFVDGNTGQPIIREIKRPEELYPTGPARDLLPDLIVQWNFSPVAADRQLVSEKFGTIDAPLPGKNISGRAGNHRPQGFLLASGPDITGGVLQPHHIQDLAPTVYALLGQNRPAWMQGQPISLTGDPAPAR